MEDNIVDRFLSIPTMEGISKNKFEASLGKASGYFNVLKKNGSTPSAEILQIFISEYPKYSLRWILLGEGEPLRKDEKVSDKIIMMEEPEKYVGPNGAAALFVDLLMEGLKDPKVIKRIQEITGTSLQSIP
ncbi:hypothetical protein [Leeuwenhoekiella sp. CH_XMU1409-2]|uniref:hypothetical protein n=1 Tax=Leeuwenhoekiella sp. CH_XMU1409-2 TaxID=3107768 RepID=UPI00300AB7C9